MVVTYAESREFTQEQVIRLYTSCSWSSAEHPNELMSALRNSHSVITAWMGDRIVGLVNAISDGALVVYYPHLLVSPDARGRGIGTQLMKRMRAKYDGFHQQVLLSYEHATSVYEKAGFSRAPTIVPFWVYSGD